MDREPMVIEKLEPVMKIFADPSAPYEGAFKRLLVKYATDRELHNWIFTELENARREAGAGKGIYSGN